MFGKPAIDALTLIQLEVDKSRNFPESAHLRSPTRGRLGGSGHRARDGEAARAHRGASVGLSRLAALAPRPARLSCTLSTLTGVAPGRHAEVACLAESSAVKFIPPKAQSEHAKRIRANRSARPHDRNRGSSRCVSDGETLPPRAAYLRLPRGARAARGAESRRCRPVA